ncbi:MAG: thioredoxin, partial [Bacteroidetes bacterium]|nr:thioredoxin [Bacteroidota bacterium]
MSVEVQNFQEDVIEASSEVPILVDFWAEWCGPCRVLGPVLEKLEAEQNGEWRLAKVDTDQHPEVSMQYGIRGIPAVKLFVDGNVVSEFTGALPEIA